MISYKLLAIFTVVIVIRSSCGEETECEKSLKEVGIVFGCGFLNYNHVRQYKNTDDTYEDVLKTFLRDYGILILFNPNNQVPKKITYIERYCNAVFNFVSKNNKFQWESNSYQPLLFCSNMKKKPIHAQLDVKMDERLKVLEIPSSSSKSRKTSSCFGGSKGEFATTFTVAEAAIANLYEAIKTCNWWLFAYHMRNDIYFSKENKYKNVMIAHRILELKKIGMAENYPKTDDFDQFYLVHKEPILHYLDSDKDGIPNDYTQFLLPEFCKSNFPDEYQNENDNINES